MALFGSQPQRPLPWRALGFAVVALWLAPMALGLAGLLLFAMLSQPAPEIALGLWFGSYALLLSPVFSWIGWLIALPAIATALWRGWFGWITALAVGAGAGGLAGAVVESALSLPFGMIALGALRAGLGRQVPL